MLFSAKSRITFGLVCILSSWMLIGVVIVLWSGGTDYSQSRMGRSLRHGRRDRFRVGETWS